MGPAFPLTPEAALKEGGSGSQGSALSKSLSPSSGPKASPKVSPNHWQVSTKGLAAELGLNTAGALAYLGLAEIYKGVTGKKDLSTGESLAIGGAIAVPVLAGQTYLLHRAGYSWLAAGGRSLATMSKGLITSAGAFITAHSILHFAGLRGWKQHMGTVGLGTLFAATPLGRAVTTGLAGGGYLGMKIDEWTGGAWSDWGCSLIEDNIEFAHLVKGKTLELHGEAVDFGVKAIEKTVEVHGKAVDAGVELIEDTVAGAKAVKGFLADHLIGHSLTRALKYKMAAQRARIAKLTEAKRLRELRAKNDRQALKTQGKVTGNPTTDRIFAFMKVANQKPESLDLFDELQKCVGGDGTVEFLELHDNGASTFKITLTPEAGKSPVEFTWRPGTEAVVLDPALISPYGHHSYAPVAYR